MKFRAAFVVVLLALAPLVFVVFVVSVFGQIPYSGQYNRGQDVVPVYEGFMPNPDGTYTMYFGYFNRNYEEQLDIPLGPNNTMDPGSDRGQPTHFYPRRRFFVFSVVVPKDWGLERRVTWTLGIRGKTNIARGWLQPDWEINNEVMMENAGAVNDPENERPVITGSGSQTITLPASVTLTATAKDDGRPKPRRRDAAGTDEGNGPQGLSIRWIQYRGPGPVTFNSTAPAAAAANGQSLTSSTTATFKLPGVYVLRAVASDGLLEAFHDVTVTVK
jgi:hypothetical protein